MNLWENTSKKMIDPKLQEAKAARDRYRELNKNTVEKVKQFDPVLKCWHFERITTDVNASKFHEKQKPQPKPHKTVRIAPKSTKTTAVICENSLRTLVYNDFCKGMTKKELSEKHKISVRRVTVEISRRKSQLGITENNKGITYRKAVELIKKGLNNTEIGKILNVAANTISYHRKNYLKTL